MVLSVVVGWDPGNIVNVLVWKDTSSNPSHGSRWILVPYRPKQNHRVLEEIRTLNAWHGWPTGVWICHYACNPCTQLWKIALQHRCLTINLENSKAKGIYPNIESKKTVLMSRVLMQPSRRKKAPNIRSQAFRKSLVLDHYRSINNYPINSSPWRRRTCSCRCAGVKPERKLQCLKPFCWP
jgi:hypothetical protein